ncbi:hypothetical protein B0H19DRAFT_1253592 [Mycena capillaripes]|nr:hypothetical protein B0H19DRAFT_1253592 [Mycena capillaripes]
MRSTKVLGGCMCWGSPSSPKGARLSRYISFPGASIPDSDDANRHATVSNQPRGGHPACGWNDHRDKPRRALAVVINGSVDRGADQLHFQVDGLDRDKPDLRPIAHAAWTWNVDVDVARSTDWLIMLALGYVSISPVIAR